MKINNLSKRNILLSIFLLVAIMFSIITVVRGATPNPGHPQHEIDFNVVTRTGATTLTTSEHVVLADASTAAFTITLPTAVGATTPFPRFYIKKIDSALTNLVTIDANASETIDGSLTITLAQRGEAVLLQGDGSNWRVVSREKRYQIESYRTRGATLNQWYTSPNTGTALATAVLTANILRATPFIVSRTTTIDQMAINVTTAAAGATRVGIYADNGNNYPGALVVEATSAAQMDTGTVGVRTATGLSITLQPGLYWLATVSNAGPTIRGFGVASMLPVLGYAVGLPTTASLGWSVGFTYAALPATFTAGGTPITAVPIPAIFVRTSLQSRFSFIMNFMLKTKAIIIILIFGVLALGLFFSTRLVFASTLSCSVTTAGTCTGTVIWRMSGSTNAHAELPSQTTPVYANNVVCCSGVTGLSNFCSGTFAIALRLSGVTNAHVQQTGAYPQTACISVPSGGSVSIGYQANDCTGFHTTLGSMSGTTNAHVGNAAAYTIKICGTATEGVAQTLSFAISDATIGFGTLTSGAARFATGDTNGSASEVEAHNLTAATNAGGGYVISISGTTLTFGAHTIMPIGATNVPSSPGTEQFGVRAIATGGTGVTVSAPYSGAGFALDTVAFPDEFASATGPTATTTFSVRYVANIAPLTEPGRYTANLIYTITGRF